MKESVCVCDIFALLVVICMLIFIINKLLYKTTDVNNSDLDIGLLLCNCKIVQGSNHIIICKCINEFLHTLKPDVTVVRQQRGRHCKKLEREVKPRTSIEDNVIVFSDSYRRRWNTSRRLLIHFIPYIKKIADQFLFGKYFHNLYRYWFLMIARDTASIFSSFIFRKTSFIFLNSYLIKYRLMAVVKISKNRLVTRNLRINWK